MLLPLSLIGTRTLIIATHLTIKWKIVASLFFSKIVDILMSAKTTLPAFLTNLGAPVWMLSLLVPIRESGSLLPQTFIANYLTHKENRQAQWRLGACFQTLAVFLLVAVPYTLVAMNEEKRGLLLGSIVLASLVLMSLARSLSSLTMKDIQGKHIDKGRRGDLVGISSTCAGLLSLVFAISSFFSEKMNNDIILTIGVSSTLCMLLSLASMQGIETKVEIERDKNTDDQPQSSKKERIIAYLSEFKGDLGRFVLVRSCFVHTALIAPFFVVWAMSVSQDNTLVTLSAFIISQATSSIVSSYAWGKLSDKNAKLAMQLGAFLVLLVLLFVLYVIIVDEGLLQSLPSYAYVLLYFILSMGHEGARAGRKVYALDIKSGSQRTDFISKANTTIGFVLLGLGLFYSLLSVAGNVPIMVGMSLGLILGLILSLGLSKEK